MDYNPNDFIYDLESYPNVFTMTIVHANKSNFVRQYEISDRKNDIEGIKKCIAYLRNKKQRMVGFNNLAYDYTLLHMIIEEIDLAEKEGRTPNVSASDLYRKTSEIIKKMNDSEGKWYGIKEPLIAQIDLYKIWHFDNAAKATSLKMLEVNMRSENVEDLPFPVGKKLTSDEIDILLKYNLHDVMQTLKFYGYSQEALQLRVELSDKFGFDCTNYSDSKIGETLFVKRLKDANPSAFNSYGGVVNKTDRKDGFAIGDCIFNYIKFDRPEFKAVHSWLMKQRVEYDVENEEVKTKGVFNDYEEHQIGDIAKYASMKERRVLLKNGKWLDSKGKERPEFDMNDPEHMAELEKTKREFLAIHPSASFEEKITETSKSRRVKVNAIYRLVEAINVQIDGGLYVYGTGGIHMSMESAVVKEDNDWVILDADVSSMYPSISIANKVYPEHLGKTFCKVYEDLFNERKKYPKGSGPNSAIKLSLNSVFGKSNSKFSPLYDPKYTLTITINGQLSLSMLAEKFINSGFKIIQCNTDGVTALVPRSKVDEYYRITKWWEGVTGLGLEYAEYSMMALSDVNNYIAVYKDGKVKSKGRYEVAHYEKLGWSKNHSAMVIPQAVLNYVLHGVPVEKTIMENKDPYDFILRTKVPRSSKLILVYPNGNEVKQQNICRYYPSKTGGNLVKIMPPLKKGGDDRRMGIDTEWIVDTCNNINDFDWSKLNYDYYISEANKMIKGVGL